MIDRDSRGDLRLTFGSTSYRKVAGLTVVGTKVLKPGNPVLIPSGTTITARALSAAMQVNLTRKDF